MSSVYMLPSMLRDVSRIWHMIISVWANAESREKTFTTRLCMLSYLHVRPINIFGQVGSVDIWLYTASARVHA